MSLRGLLNPINDISTSFDPTPELKNGRSYPERFRAIQNELYPDLMPLTARVEAEALFAVALETARRRKNWDVVEAQPEAGRIHVVARTPLLRFRDDIVIEVRGGAGGSSLHMRSRSRLGRNDFGANAKRIRAFFAAVKTALNSK